MSKAWDRAIRLVSASATCPPDTLVLETGAEPPQRTLGEQKLLVQLAQKLQPPHLAPGSEDVVKDYLGTVHCQWIELKR